MLRMVMTVLVAATLLGGCGFHLRGKIPLPDELATVFMGECNQDADFVIAMTEAFDFSGARVVENPEAATSIMKCDEVTYERRVRTTDERGLATSYTLIYIVVFEVNGSGGKRIVKPSRLEITRELNFDAEQVLQAENEADFLREDMLRDLAQQIIRRIGAAA